MELRPYQATAVAQITAAWSRAQRVMYQLATGAGKTVIATTLCQQHLAAQPASRVVWLTHRRELRAQSAQQLGSQGLPVVDLTTVYPAKRTWLPSTVSLISPGLTALQPLLATAGAQDLLVVDEAHHSVANSWATFIAQWPGAVLGLTGTLWRMSLQEGFGHLYDELICGPSIAELIQQGYLSDFRIVSPQSLVIRGQGRAADGDYAVGATEQANSAIFYSDLPIQAWEEAAGHCRRVLWYTPSVRSAAAITERLQQKGYAAEMVQARTPVADRQRIISDFARGHLRFLVNVAIVTEGYDVPEADCIVIARPTQSKVLYWQMVGRAMRPGLGTEALILDLGRSWEHAKVGHPQDDYDWTLGARALPQEGAPVVSQCTHCQHVNPAAAHSCAACGRALGRECPGCQRFRYRKQWQELERDVLCQACVAGAAASDLRFEEAWRAPSNRSLRHESGTCVVRPVSPRDPNSWKVGYRAALTHKLQWQHPYRSFQEAWQAGQHYLAHPQSPPPEPGPAPVPDPAPPRPPPPPPEPRPRPPEPSVADPQVRIRLHYGELELEYEGPASYLESRLQPICAQLLALSPAPPPTQSLGVPAAGPGGSQRPETENHTAEVWGSEIVQGNS